MHTVFLGGKPIFGGGVEGNGQLPGGGRGMVNSPEGGGEWQNIWRDGGEAPLGTPLSKS